ncbi:hypothetical protein R3W88_030153 [Solanum pinnatisectum]|uniref:Uncharacterized protein n=1 Tax=Solanum pinnatisectum TaxID=50273 RepID=A0AAV9K8K5_9SOLN|nr:hypothetical protein R3W88_030153 [Solanum pinnatisectum]
MLFLPLNLPSCVEIYPGSYCVPRWFRPRCQVFTVDHGLSEFFLLCSRFAFSCQLLPTEAEKEIPRGVLSYSAPDLTHLNLKASIFAGGAFCKLTKLRLGNVVFCVIMYALY